MGIFEDFPRFLRQERNRKGLTQEQLAAIAEVPKSNISRMENDRQNPTLKTFGQILTGLGLDLPEFTRRYLSFRREAHGEEAGTPPASLRRELEPYLETLPERIAEVSFQTDTHYVLLIPKPWP